MNSPDNVIEHTLVRRGVQHSPFIIYQCKRKKKLRSHSTRYQPQIDTSLKPNYTQIELDLAHIQVPHK